MTASPMDSMPRVGAKVMSRDDIELGTVKEIDADCFKIDAPMAADYWLGAYAINLVVAEGFSAVVALVCLWAAWPRTAVAIVVGGVLAITMPILFFPFSRTIWLAWDLSFRPQEAGDDRAASVARK